MTAVTRAYKYSQRAAASNADRAKMKKRRFLHDVTTEMSSAIKYPLNLKAFCTSIKINFLKWVSNTHEHNVPL